MPSIVLDVGEDFEEGMRLVWLTHLSPPVVPSQSGWEGAIAALAASFAQNGALLDLSSVREAGRLLTLAEQVAAPERRFAARGSH
jgi:hypothetical protein